MKLPKDIGVLFKAEMVEALLLDAPEPVKDFPEFVARYPKLETRRTRNLGALNANAHYRGSIEKIELRDDTWCFWENGHGSSALPVFQTKCPYGKIGDRLWVRETFLPKASGVIYRADYDPVEAAGLGGLYGGWKPAIHLPRKLCRIELEVTSITVERIREITEEGAKAEGVKGVYYYTQPDPPKVKPRDGDCFRKTYERLWAEINGYGSWMENHFVWVVKFKRLKP